MPVRAASCECGVKRRRKPGGGRIRTGRIICDAKAVSMRNERQRTEKRANDVNNTVQPAEMIKP